MDLKRQGIWTSLKRSIGYQAKPEEDSKIIENKKDD